MGVVLTSHPHLALILKKEQRYTSTSPLGIHALFKAEIYYFLRALVLLTA
jgi:hypothetical protein